MKKKIIIILSVGIVFIWMILIYSFSNASSDQSNRESKGLIRHVLVMIYGKDDVNIDKLTVKYNKPVRKIAHITVYLILSVFINSACFSIKKLSILHYNLISIILSFLYACTDEYHQTFITNRSGQYLDIFIDFIGIILGCLLFNFVYLRYKDKSNIRDYN